jgi:hypothetical protein
MNDIAKSLLEKKQKIENAKIELAKLEGSYKTNMEQLKKEFDCSSVEEGELKLQEIENTLKQMDEEIEKGFEEVEKAFKKIEEAKND